MKNFIQPGKTVTININAGLTSGSGVLVGTMFGVCNMDSLANQDNEIDLTGVFDLPKAATITPAVGSAVYWDNTAKNVTTVSTGGNTKIGVNLLSPQAGDATIRVRLNGAF
jgi:predicted RecA/RadA family phage recombinase